MPPTAPTLHPVDTAPDLDAIRGTIREALDADKHLTQIRIGQQTGYSASAISAFLAGRYAGDNAQLAAALSGWVDKYRSSRSIADLLGDRSAWIETPTARRVWNALSGCQTMADFSLIYGHPGTSKTVTAERYAATYRPVWIVTARPSIAARHPFLCQITTTLKGEAQASGTDRTLSNGIIKHIAGTEGLLVIDEAQYLRKETIDELRAIHDASGTAMCLMGNDLVYARTHGDGQGHEFAQLIRRCKYKVAIKRPTKGDVRAVAQHFGIDDDEEIAVLEDIAKTPGAIDHCIAAIRMVLISDEFGGRITADGLRRIADEWAVHVQ